MAALTADRVFGVFSDHSYRDTALTREYELARDLVDGPSLDLIRQNALMGRFGAP